MTEVSEMASKYNSGRSIAKIAFRGLDMSTPRFQVDSSRALDMNNYIWRDNAVQKRFGTEPVLDIPTTYYYDATVDGIDKSPKLCVLNQFTEIHSMWVVGDFIVVHKGCLLFFTDGSSVWLCGNGKYRNETGSDNMTHNYSGAYIVPDRKFGAIYGNGALWLFTGEGFYKLTIEFSEDNVPHAVFKRVADDKDTYVPTTTVGITSKESGIGARSTIEGGNLLNSKRKNGIATSSKDEPDKNGVYEYVLDSKVDGTKPIEVEISSIIPKYTDETFGLQSGILSKDGKHILYIPENMSYRIPVVDNAVCDPSVLPIFISNADGSEFSFYGLLSDHVRLVCTEGNTLKPEIVLIDPDTHVFGFPTNATSSVSGLRLYFGANLADDELATNTSYFELPYIFYNVTANDGMLSRLNPNVSLDGEWEVGKRLDACTGGVVAYGNRWPVWGLYFSMFRKPKDFYPTMMMKTSMEFPIATVMNDNAFAKAVREKFGDSISVKGTNPTSSMNTFKIHATSEKADIKYSYTAGKFGFGHASFPKFFVPDASLGNGTLRTFSLYLIDDEGFFYGYMTETSLVLFDNWVGDDSGSNITISFHSNEGYDPGKIDGCTFGTLFGAGGARNRLFLSGNSEFPNADWHSGDDFTYFTTDMDTPMYYGSSATAVVGYGCVSDGTLMVVKEASDIEPSVFYRKASTQTVTDEVGNTSNFIGDAPTKIIFTLVRTNSKTGGKKPWLFTDFCGDSVFVDEQGRIVGLDSTGTTADERRIASSRSARIDRAIRDETGAVLYDDNEYLYYPQKDWLYAGTRIGDSYEWFRWDIPNVTCFVKFNGYLMFANRVGEIKKFTKGNFTDTDAYEVPDGTLNKANSSADIAVDTTSDFYRIITLDSDYMKKLYENEPVPWDNLSVEEREKAVAEVFREKGRGELQLNFPKYACRGYLYAKTLKGSVGDSRYNFSDSRTRISDIALASYLIGKKATLKYGSIYITGTFENGTTADDSEMWLRFVSDTQTQVSLNGYYRCDIEFTDVEVEYEIKASGLLHLSIDGFLLYPTSFSGLEIRGVNPVVSYFLCAPFTAGTLNYKKAIWSYTINSDTYDENFTTIYRATDSNHIDSMVMADMGTKFLTNNSVTKKYSLANYDRERTTYDRMRVPNSFTAFKPMSVAFVCFNFKSELPRNSTLTGMEFTYSIAKTAFGRM